jgi:Mn2+/Fe2+ NRAMP family transporter
LQKVTSFHSFKTFLKGPLAGAAFLMATSAIGPGFITQTTVFTQQLLSSFGFVILISVLLDIIVQLNIWRIVAVAQLQAQDIANKVFPGMGYVLAALIVLGGLAFNIGNIAGAGLGLNVLIGTDVLTGAAISTAIALFIFWMKEAGTAMDWFAKILGFVMIGLTIYVAIQSQPPLLSVLHHSILPQQVSTTAIITLVGGTVGGYISFAGAHRLLAAGVKGEAQLQQVSKSSILAIVVAAVMRVLLFLAALGVVLSGAVINKDNPAAHVFQLAAGTIGYKIFGVVLWSAAITSVVGAAYTSVSFISNFHPWLKKQERSIISGFIIFSMLVFALVGKPVKVLVLVGALNGLILPVALALLLLAAHNKKIIGNYKHAKWLSIAGWLVVLVMGYMGLQLILTDLF